MENVLVSQNVATKVLVRQILHVLGLRTYVNVRLTIRAPTALGI